MNSLIDEDFNSEGSIKQSTGSTLNSVSSYSTVEFSPKMTPSDIVDKFDPKVIAKEGNHFEKNAIVLKIREISNKESNNIFNREQINKIRSVKSMMTIDTINTPITATQKKYSDSEKYGEINKSLIDLNTLIYGLKEDDGIYLLCFNMEKLLKYVQQEKNKVIIYNPILSYLQHTIKSIYNKSPLSSVVLIGTHLDQIKEEEVELIDLLIKKVFRHKHLKRLIKYKKERKLFSFFPIDSITKKNISELKTTILKRITKTAKNTIAKRDTVPVKFIRAMDVLRIYKQREKKNFISREKLFEIISDFGFNSMEEMVPLLKFLSARNEIIYFDNVDLLKDFIVLNKAFLYFSMYQIINRKYVNKILNDKGVKSHLKEKGLNKDLVLFNSKKLLSRDLIEFIWRSNNHFIMKRSEEDGELYFDENRAAYLYILEMMKKVLFVTEWKNTMFNIPSSILEESHSITADNILNIHVENLFLVPSLVKNSQSKAFAAHPKSKIRNLNSITVQKKESMKGKAMTLRKKNSELMNNKVNSGPATTKARRNRKSVKRGNRNSIQSRVEKEDGRRLSIENGFVQSSRAKREFSIIKGRGRSKENLREERVSSKKTNSSSESANKSTGRNNRKSMKRDLKKAQERRKKKSDLSIDVYNQLEFKSGRYNRDKERQPSVTLAMRQMIKKRERESKSTISDPILSRRYLLDRNKPVSLLLDFNEGFLPDGFFLRLCSLLYTACIGEIQSEQEIQKIDQIELHKNYFKLVFDKVMKKTMEEEESESLYESEFESISILVDPKKIEGKEDKEYIMLYLSTNQDSLIFVVRNHQQAPFFMNILLAALEVLDGEEVNSCDFGMSFYSLDVQIKVEVKNNKFIPLQSAKEREFAPWFSRNKLKKKNKSMKSMTDTLPRKKNFKQQRMKRVLKNEDPFDYIN